MAEIAKSGNPSLCSPAPPSSDFLACVAGESIAPGDSCYIASTGLAMRCNGSAVAAASRCRGQAAQFAYLNGGVTLMQGQRFNYATGLTPGADVYLSTTVVGGLATANATVTAPVGYAVDAGRIQFFRPY